MKTSAPAARCTRFDTFASRLIFAVTVSTLSRMFCTHTFGMSSTTSYSGYSCDRAVLR